MLTEKPQIGVYFPKKHLIIRVYNAALRPTNVDLTISQELKTNTIWSSLRLNVGAAGEVWLFRVATIESNAVYSPIKRRHLSLKCAFTALTHRQIRFPLSLLSSSTYILLSIFQQYVLFRFTVLVSNWGDFQFLVLPSLISTSCYNTFTDIPSIRLNFELLDIVGLKVFAPCKKTLRISKGVDETRRDGWIQMGLRPL